MMSTPPGSAPDERAHYLKAAAAGRGQVILSQGPAGQPADLGITQRWQFQQSRVVVLPRSLSAEVIDCRSTPGRLTDCNVQEIRSQEPAELSTYVGSYPPATYLLPGLIMRLGGDSMAALRLGRLGFALISIAFIALATWVVWDPRLRGRSLLGLIAVTTPMVLYTASTLSPSGPEAAAAICFFACVVRVARREPAPGWVWTALGVSAFALAVARDLGVVWLGLGVAFMIALVGIGGTAYRVRTGGKPAVAAGVLGGLGLIVAVGWQMTVQEHPGTQIGTLLATLAPSFGLFQAVYFQIVGAFGVLDTYLPLAAYAGWTLLFGGLTAAALWLGSNRQRVLLALTALGGVALIAVLDAVQRGVGFGAQGRHVLPVVIAFGLLAGEMVVAREKPVNLRWVKQLPVALGSLAAVVHGLGWYVAARRYSVGVNGPVMFLGEAQWSPPAGWALWGAVMVAAALLLVVGSAVVKR